MRTLTQMAKNIGFDVPLYTATGWNGTFTGGILPVMGGYCDAPQDHGIVEIEPSGNYIFSHERNDLSIGSDIGFGAALSYDTTKFPFLTAELGGGLQVKKHRRVIPTPQDIAAMSVAKLGSEVNLLGYYMYHGGVNLQLILVMTAHKIRQIKNISDIASVIMVLGDLCFFAIMCVICFARNFNVLLYLFQIWT